ncbi:MAG: hypothetical protein ACQGVK_12100 [Myxococcota bacterium]
MSDETYWRRCSACKEPIALGSAYFVCSVSTCNRKRTGLAFCSVSCWEVHLPVARHREAWAVEETAPTSPEPADAASGAAAGTPARERPRGQRRIVRPAGDEASPARPARDQAPREVLIVASRLKEFVRARSGFNTSERVLDPLSDIVREVCEEAIRNAERDGRKTVLDRDIPRRR